MVKATFGLDENVASALCYVLVWVTGLIFFLVERDNKTVRFHAMQSIVVFLPLQILYWIASWFFFFFSWLIGIVIFILWIVLIIKVFQGEKFKVPIAGDIAENQVK